MKHVRPLSQVQAPALGATTPMEQLVLFFLTLGFGHWDNFTPVMQNLRKFYSKT